MVVFCADRIKNTNLFAACQGLVFPKAFK